MADHESTSARPQCSHEGCDHRHHARGLCYHHYLSLWVKERREAQSEVNAFKSQMRSQRRFWSRVEVPVDGDGCWIWTGCKAGFGYGRPMYRGRSRSAHRIAYELLVGPIPAGLELDHLCRNPPCVNPAHLEPVTHQVNLLRGVSPVAVNVLKTHCPKGHPYSGRNLKLGRSSKAGRQCRECKALATNKTGVRRRIFSEAEIRQVVSEYQRGSGRYAPGNAVFLGRHFGVSRVVITHLVKRHRAKYESQG